MLNSSLTLQPQVRPTSTIARNQQSERALSDLYCIDTRNLETLGLDDPFAPSCILLVEWDKKLPRLRRDWSVEIILGAGGGNCPQSLADDSLNLGTYQSWRDRKIAELFAGKGLPTVGRQHRLGDISIN